MLKHTSATQPIITVMLMRLRPPNGVRARICWISLALCLVSIGTGVPMLVFASPDAPVQRAAAIGGLGWLACAYLRACRRGRFPRGQQLLEGLAVGLAAATLGDFRMALGFFFAPLLFRGLYGSAWEVGLTVVSFATGYVGSSQVWPALNGRVPVVGMPEMINLLYGMLTTGVQMHVFAIASARHERAASRERSLARAGASLVAATDRHQLEVAALAATRAALAETSVTRVALIDTRAPLDSPATPGFQLRSRARPRERSPDRRPSP